MSDKTWRRWSGIVRKALGGNRRRVAAPPRRLRPQVEFLESRLAPAAPGVVDLAPSSLTGTSAVLGGTVTLGNTDPHITQRGILYGQGDVNLVLNSGNPNVHEVDDPSATTGTFSDTVSGLSPNTNYVFAAFATNSDGTGYGSVTGFMTTSGGSTDVLAGGLDFRAVSGTFSKSGNTYTTSATVQVGFAPAAGQTFAPLVTLDGTTTVNTNALTFSSTGAVKTGIDGSATTLLNSISGAGIASLTGGGVTGLSGPSFTVADTPFALSSLALNATGAAGQPEVQLHGSLALPVGLSVGVNGSNHVNVSGSGIHLSGVSAALNGSFHVGGVSFNASQLSASYHPATNAFTLTGSSAVSVSGIGNLGVDFGGGSTAGLVITNGALTSLDTTVNADFSVAGVSFTASGLEFSYSTSNSQFSLTGSAGVSVAGIGNLNVTFGHSGQPGLVITGGSLTSLDMTVDSNIRVNSVTFSTTGLEFTYAAASHTFTLAGSAAVTVSGIGNLSITFGHGTSPGLVITGGSLVSLDMTVDSDIRVNSVEFSTTGLEFTYTTSTKTFTLAGTASVTVGGIDNVSVTFGHGSSPGLVITSGSLVSLDMTLNSNIQVKAVAFSTKDLEFTYTTATHTFTLAGTASVTVGGISNMSVTFGHDSSPGLVITGGSLVSLDMTLNSNIHVNAVTFGTKDLEFTYTRATDTFTLAGTAFVTVAHISNMSVTFGHGSSPGLVITSGSLVSLDMTLNSNIQVDAVTFGTHNLEFTYTASNSTYTLAGTAFVTVGGVGQFSVTFGHGGNPGLVITNGSLVSIDTTVNSSVSVGALTFQVRALEMTYASASHTFTMTGGASFTALNLATLNVTFGDGGTQGLVITNGSLTSLDMTVDSNVTLGGLTFVSDLHMTYNGAASQFVMTGDATVTVAGIGNLTVLFGSSGSQGLVITNGSLTSLDMTIHSGLNLAALTFSGDLHAVYTAAQSKFVATGTATASVPGLANLTVNLGGGGTQGLVITNGSLTSLNMSVTNSFGLAGVTFASGQLVMTYAASHVIPAHFVNYFGFQIPIPAVTVPSQLTVTGSESINFGPLSGVRVQLGGSNSAGIVISNGHLTSLDMSASVPFNIEGIRLGSVQLHVTYSASPVKWTFGGAASVTLPSLGGSLSWVDTFFPAGASLGTVGFFIQYIQNNNSSSYADVHTNIAGEEIGLRVDFNGNWSIEMGDPLLAAVQVLTYDASKAYYKTATALSDAYLKAAHGVTGVYNATVSDLDSGWHSFESGLSSAGHAIKKGWHKFKSLFGPLANATIYYDANDDFDLANDPSTTTADDGSFDLSAILTGSETRGQLVVAGGTDQSTGIANPFRLTAPVDAAVITPLTTLVNDVMQQTGFAEADANLWVDQALGLSPTIVAGVGNVLTQALAGDAASARAFAAEVEVTSALYEINGLLRGLPGAPSAAVLGSDILGSLATAIANNAGSTYDLTQSANVLSLIEASAAEAGLTVDGTVASGAATVISRVNQYIAGLPVSGSAAYLNRVVKGQVIAEGTIAPQLTKVASGKLAIATLLSNETASDIASQAHNATVGSLDLDGPTLSITGLVSQPAGNGDPTTMTFLVYLTNPPSGSIVSVDYTTNDLTAVAGDDYTTTADTLTWLPGDTAPKAITVPVFAGSTIAADKEFEVDLSDAINADIDNGTGVGDITYADYATTTGLTASNTSPNWGDAVTLTATVGYAISPAPDAGTVTFYDGPVPLGSAALDSNGVATLTTSALTGGTHSLTASYSGWQDLGVNHDPSVSAALPVNVAPAPQTITFDPLPSPVPFGTAPFELGATASSGLPVSYRVVSGPALVSGDVLTITAAGTVVVEASQSGDGGTAAATPVDQSFDVAPAGADSTPPSSRVAVLPPYSPAVIPVHWSGQANNGSGLSHFDVYVSDNHGAFVPWLLDTPAVSANYAGKAGHTYGFSSVATDNFGYQQPTPSAAQATTKVPVLTDVTKKVKVTRSSLTTNHKAGTRSGSVSITNTSGAAINGGLAFAWKNLSAGAAVQSVSVTVKGVTTALAVGGDGKGNAEVVISSKLLAKLAAGQTITLHVVYDDPTAAAVNFVPDLFSYQGR